MSDDDVPVPDAVPAAGLPRGIVQRDEGVFLDLSLAPAQLRDAVEQLFQSGQLLAGLDYGLFLLTLFHAPAPRAAPKGDALLRIAVRVAPFPPQRRALYKQVKIRGDSAEFYFEALPADADGQVPARREFDELVADLWCKGVHYGIDGVAVRAILGSGKAERITVARALPPQPGRDARLAEVSQGIHRDDAPRERSDGRLDLLSFKNRFPQVKKHARLLRLLPGAPGLPGYDLAGKLLPPPAPLELDLATVAGAARPSSISAMATSSWPPRLVT
ncbi:DUF342 domain-containing protein [Janthinobacterium sp. FW305-129]|uniref:flagellar assembly protein A n=1 Tax=Janthinobacterium sp. FW305-129 TaxID=2775054 RepID=UPI002E79D35D|nr:flagellar assembly protein A [Janthinobacterium sp. FW305-129]MCC7598963.1 DUF342 domain-containing protein [Janthinobacterium sp. FW305-129]